MVKDFNKQVTIDYTTLTEHSFDPVNLDTPNNLNETRWTNSQFRNQYTMFVRSPKTWSAIIMRAIWTVGKGYTCDAYTDTALNSIDGDGKQSFLDILFNMSVNEQIGGDAYAEIITDDELIAAHNPAGVLNLKILDPSSITIIYGEDGRIKRYEQASPTGSSATPRKFDRDKIFHMRYGNFAGSMHGIGLPERMEKIIITDDKLRITMDRIAQFQAVPFIIFKVKSDDAASIARFEANILSSREKGKDMIIPDDENILEWEIVQVNPSSFIMERYNSNNNEFFRGVNMPMVLFGTADTTESGGKIEYTGHETTFQHHQKRWEEQIKRQLGFTINLNSPVSLLENLQTDEKKDQQNALTYEQGDVNPNATTS